MQFYILSIAAATVIFVPVLMFIALGLGISKGNDFIRDNPDDPDRFKKSKAVTDELVGKWLRVITIIFAFAVVVIVILSFISKQHV